MSNTMYPKISESYRQSRVGLLAVLLVMLPTIGAAEIIWNGSHNTKTWYPAYLYNDTDNIGFWHVPEYGRPVQTFDNKIYPSHVGDGSLLSLETSPTRGSKYSTKFTIKNSAHGSEPADCDPGGSTCTRRRSNIQMTSAFTDNGVMPYNTERWISFSFYLPADYNTTGSGWGPGLWGSKGSLEKAAGMFGVHANENGWQLIHRNWEKEVYLQGPDAMFAQYWKAIKYDSTYPNSTSGGWPAGLVDFPNEAASKAVLSNLNRGGWTDFMWHWKTDIDPYEQNDGFCDVYMRAGSGPWVHVLALRPMKDLALQESWRSSNPERIYDRGIGQYGPKGNISSIGIYVDKDLVWNNANDLVIYMDNYKIGDENATFEDMTHDGSSFGGGGGRASTQPNAPNSLSAE